MKKTINYFNYQTNSFHFSRLKLVCLSLLLVAVFVFGCLPGCSPAEKEENKPTQSATVKVSVLKGPSSIGVVELMDRDTSAASINYDFNIAGSIDVVVAALTSGSTDIAALPSNMASNMFQKTNGDIVVLAISSLGNFSIIESGTTVNTLSDLRGKTVHASGQGANPQYILEYLLAQSGLVVGSDVEIIWHSEHSELLALLASGEVELAMLPEPFTTTALAKNSNLRAAIKLDDLWEKETGQPLVTGCIVARADFIKGNEALVDALLADLNSSVAWTQANHNEAAALCAKYDIIADEAIAKKALSSLSLTFLAGEDMANALSAYLEILHAANPASVGSSLPEASFYYKGKP